MFTSTTIAALGTLAGTVAATTGSNFAGHRIQCDTVTGLPPPVTSTISYDPPLTFQTKISSSTDEPNTTGVTEPLPVGPLPFPIPPSTLEIHGTIVPRATEAADVDATLSLEALAETLVKLKLAIVAYEDASKDLAQKQKAENELEDLAFLAEMDPETKAQFEEKLKIARYNLSAAEEEAEYEQKRVWCLSWLVQKRKMSEKLPTRCTGLGDWGGA